MYLFTFFSVSLTSQHAKVSASLKYKYVGKIMILDPACWKNKKYVGSRRSHKKWTLVRLKTNYRSSGRPVHHRFSDIGWGKRETLQQHQQKKLLRTTLECWCKRRSTQKDTFFRNWSFFTSSIELLFLLFFF